MNGDRRALDSELGVNSCEVRAGAKYHQNRGRFSQSFCPQGLFAFKLQVVIRSIGSILKSGSWHSHVNSKGSFLSYVFALEAFQLQLQIISCFS